MAKKLKAELVKINRENPLRITFEDAPFNKELQPQELHVKKFRDCGF